MNELLNLNLLNAENPLPIRTTPDQVWMSVFDLLQAFSGAKNPHQQWEDIKGAVLPQRENCFSTFQFEGERQRPTPVVNREGFVKLLTFLGSTGRLPKETAEKLWGITAKVLLETPKTPAQLPNLTQQLSDLRQSVKALEKEQYSRLIQENLARTANRHVLPLPFSALAQDYRWLCEDAGLKPIKGEVLRKYLCDLGWTEVSVKRRGKCMIPPGYGSERGTGREISTRSWEKGLS